MDYLIYFIFPLILGIAGARFLRQRLRVFLIGGATFFVAWIICQTIAGVATTAFGWGETALLYAVTVSLSAGIFEESARYVVFSRLGAFRNNRNWKSSLTYAFGHHGMETMIVGFVLLLTFLVVTYKPDAISDPALLERSRAVVALGTGAKLYNAFERLIVGLLIHACFSAVVMLAVARGRPRFLLVAMLWHFAHNMIGFNLHRLSDHWLVSKVWIAVILVSYSIILFRLCRLLADVGESIAIQPGQQAAGAEQNAGNTGTQTRSP